MNETKFEPFIKGSMAVLMLCVLVCMAVFIPSGSEALDKVAQPIPVVSELCESSVSPETAAVAKRIIMTPPPVISETPVEDLNPYADLVVTDTEKELLACMVYNEARGEPFEGQVAVVLVALNRYIHEAFDGSISDILLAPNQFSVGNTYGDEQMKAVEAALAGDPALDLNTDVVFFSTGSLTYGSYYKTICCHVFRTYE